MTWINTINFEQATGRLRKLYEKVVGPDNNVDNILMSHSLRPHTLEGHMALYKNVLHHTANKLPKYLLEAIGVFVSYLNRCDYCVDHHFEGYRKLLKNDKEAFAFKTAVESGELSRVLTDPEIRLFNYAEKLTKSPNTVSVQDIEILRASGYDDGEILEVNQVAAYFNYANRTVLGLGVVTQGDELGLSPNSSDSNDWQHQ